MAVREGLLSLLAEGPRRGNQLKTGFEAATGGVWPLNVGQVYTTLDRLERDGLVAVRESDGQKTYELTPAGGAALGEWWQAVPADEPPPRDELMLKVLMAVEVGRELRSTRYTDRKGRSKQVRYWAMEVAGGEFVANHEVDEVRWLPRGEAVALLSYDHDRGLVDEPG